MKLSVSGGLPSSLRVLCFALMIIRLSCQSQADQQCRWEDNYTRNDLVDLTVCDNCGSSVSE